MLSILEVLTQYIGRILELLLRRIRRFVEDKITIFVGLCRIDYKLWDKYGWGENILGKEIISSVPSF